MTEVVCSECKSTFPDVFSFRTHFTISHQNVTSYTCAIGDCTRKFNAYPSFRKHVILYHKVPVFSSQGQPCVNTSSNDAINTIDNCDLDQGFIDNSNSVPDSVKTLCDVEDLLIAEQDYLVAKLYSNPAFPRNLVDSIIKDFTRYLTSPFFERMREVVTSSLDPQLSSAVKSEIDKMFDILMEPFPHLQTEYLRLNYFASNGEYIAPVPYEIYSREERIKTKNGVVLQMKQVLGQFIPLRQLLAKFFQLPHALQDTLSYMASLSREKDWLFNLIQCDIWKRKVSVFRPDEIVIPLNLYYDEVEPNMVLGPHTDPLGCSYIQIATLPPEWNSRLENIFLALLFDADNRSIYGNERAFKPLITELIYLEKEGILVETKEKGMLRIKFVVALILGDNKGLNDICGFSGSFSATHFCRLCKCTKVQSATMLVEDKSLLRTVQNYNEDVLMDNYESTGIKEKNVFDKIPSFETPSDICVDEFHDLVEGVAHYTMVPVLIHFHRLNYMFIPTLNSRLYSTDLGVDNDNRPPGINEDRLLTNKKLKMTGAEMYLFVRIFGILVYDMIPDGDLFYELYLRLHDVMSIVHAKSLPADCGPILAVAVKDHNKLYLRITDELLKPKHHFLEHYAGLLQKIGPFGTLSTIRFEAKHHLLRQTASTCMSRVNLCRTVAIKQQLGFCFRCVSNASIRQPLVAGPSYLVNLKELSSYASLSLTLPDTVFEHPMQSVVKWVEFKGTKYAPKQVIMLDVDPDGLFIFAEIELILIHDSEPLLICSSLKTLGYFSEVRGYEVQRMQNVQNWVAIGHGQLLDPFPLCLYTMPSGEHIIVLRNLL